MSATAVFGVALANVLASTKAAHAQQSSQGPHDNVGNPGGNYNECPSSNPNCICFVRGTQIETLGGETAIEDLSIGDLVATVSRKAKPIKWVGRMRFERQGDQPWHAGVLPVLVTRGSLDGVLPTQDLYVSDAHCFLINGMLIPAIHLVNGRSIRKCTSYEAEAIEYFHIELDSHDVVFANGAPAETLQGNSNRRNFDNYDQYVQLYGPELVTMTPFAPVVGNFGGRQELRSRLRSMLAPVYDRRKPLDVIRDEIASQADRRQAA